MTTERIDIIIREDGSRIVRRNLESMGDSAKGAEKSIFDLKRTLATLGIGVLVHELARAADEMTTLRSRLLLVSDSLAHARTTFNDLYVIAQRTRASFADLGQTYTSIARAAQSLGIAQTRILRVTETISNAMAIGGGTAESMRAALVQLSQAMASNRLGGEEFRSVMEQAPRLTKAIADGLDVTIG
jgi:tape measure domain-containing protein